MSQEGDMRTLERGDLAPVLAGIAADALDCIQTNLAVLADAAHGGGTHVRLGALLQSALPKPGHPPTVEASVEQRLTEATRLLGLRIEERHDGLDGAGLCALAAGGREWYVVADTITLPWTPYHGQRSMEHTFLLRVDGGRHEIVDAYHNDTPWGSVRPGAWDLGAEALGAAVPSPEASALLIAPAALPPHDAGSLLDDLAASLSAPDRARAADAYVAGYRDHPAARDAFDRLTLDTWLLARERLLHTYWLERVAGAPDRAVATARGHAERWAELARQVYLAFRRVERGRPAPPAVFEDLAALLHADVTLTAWRSSTPAPPVDAADVGRSVRAAVGGVLAIDAGEIDGAEALADVPGFNSFALADVLERLEQELGVEVPPEELTPANYRSLDSLSGLFSRLAGVASGEQGGAA